jgi:hypothetical protein
MPKRITQGVVVCILGVIMLGAGGPSSRFSRIGHQMICVCSCGQVLLECNHVGCPDSDRMIGELRQQIATVGTGFLIRVWKLRSGTKVAVSSASSAGFRDVGTDAVRERIRQETEY